MKKHKIIKELCEQTIEECKEFIFGRAKHYAEGNELSEQDREDLLEYESTGIVLSFDQEDSENHNFDLGKICMAKEILRLLAETE